MDLLGRDKTMEEWARQTQADLQKNKDASEVASQASHWYRPYQRYIPPTIAPGTCPSCGYCRHCGRGGAGQYDWYMQTTTKL